MTFLPLNIRFRITLKSSQAKKLLNKSFFIICVYICHTFLRQISTFVDFPVLLSPSLTSCIYVCQVWTSLNYNHIRFMTEWLLVEYKLQGYRHVIIITLSTTQLLLFTSSVSKCAKMMMISVVFSIYKNIKKK